MALEACPDCGQPLPAVRRPRSWRQALWGARTCSHCGSEIDRSGRKLNSEFPRATDPGLLKLSKDKLRILRPELFGLRAQLGDLMGRAFPERQYLATQLRQGDSRAAIVMSERPLLIAAYTDELDCVAMLRFSEILLQIYSLRSGSRLLSVNSYRQDPVYDEDLIPGPQQRHRWTGFHPLIAEFLSDDFERIEQRKRQIAEQEWQRAAALGESYLKLKPGIARDGRPIFSATPARGAN